MEKFRAAVHDFFLSVTSPSSRRRWVYLTLTRGNEAEIIFCVEHIKKIAQKNPQEGFTLFALAHVALSTSSHTAPIEKAIAEFCARENLDAALLRIALKRVKAKRKTA